MTEWPRAYHPVRPDGTVDTSRTVELYVHTVENTVQVAAWCGGEIAIVNGGPVVVVGGTKRAVERLCGLGDFAARDGDRWWAERADGLYQRLQPAQGGATPR